MTTILESPTEGREPISLGGTESPEMVAYREQTQAFIAAKFEWSRKPDTGAADADPVHPAPTSPVYSPPSWWPRAAHDPVLDQLDRERQAASTRRKYVLHKNVGKGVPSC